MSQCPEQNLLKPALLGDVLSHGIGAHIPLISQFEIHFLELLKFQIFLMKNPQGAGNPYLDHWLHFLLNPSDEKLAALTI
jgi:hypothetical protein